MSSIKPDTPFIWVPDANVEQCSYCDVNFTMFNRKHHCRFCGKIFCSECLPFMQELSWSDNGLQKCCMVCNEKIDVMKKNKNKNLILCLLPLTIMEKHVFLYVNKSWNKTASYIISVFKAIQYKLTYHRWTKIERLLINTHFNQFKSHSRLFIQSLKCLYGSNLNSLMKQQEYKTSCKDLYCDCFCANTITIYDIIDLLSNKPLVMEYDTVLNYIIRAIENIETDAISLFLPWFLNIGVNKACQLFILKALLPRCDNLNFVYKMYFECKLLFDTSYKEFYVSITQKILMNNKYSEEILKTERFVQAINSGVFRMQDKNVRMPYNPHIIVTNILNKKIKKIASFTQPIKIPMETNIGIRNILIKKEDVRPDRLAVLMMYIMNQYEDFNFKPYSVFCVSQDEGWIEMLNNVETLYDIEKKNSIQNYILSKNPNKNIKELRRLFIKSCASNCILTYILGVGDRNLCNILVHDEGHLIHIDYSYLLGHDPKWQKVEMRITPGMLDMLGGMNSVEYQQLQILCTSMFKQVRKYSFFWSAFIHYLSNTKPAIVKYYGKKIHIKTHIEQRLMLNSSSEQINMFIIDTVNKNSGSSLMSYISDTLFDARTTLDEYMFKLEM